MRSVSTYGDPQQVCADDGIRIFTQ
jgi:hypothetical protein